MATSGREFTVLAILAMALAAAGCGGGGGGGGGGANSLGGTTSVAATPTADVAANRVDQPYLFIGTCYICGRSNAALQGTLDGESFPGSRLDSDAVVIARGTQSITTAADGSRVGTYAFREFAARSVVVGHVEWIDPARGRIGILGQDMQGFGPWVGALVDVPPGGGVEPSLAITRLDIGQRVRVFGFDTDGGPIVATGVHDALADSPERVTGRVTPWNVRSPVSCPRPSSSAVRPVELKMISGNFSGSK